MATLALKGLRKSYGTVETIAGVDLQVESGELVVFVGPSGCGKSTLLRMIAGLEDISDGELEIDGQNVTHVAPAQRGVAMVFQSYALYPHMTVYDNMAFGLSLAGTSKDELHQRVTRAADILQLGALLQRKPKELSGGQRQRVAIGRAIVRKPKVFLFDEPLSNLDAALRVQMRIELARLHADLKATMVYVTHDQVEAMTLADRIVVINKGRIEQVGTPLELYHRPANLFVAGFMGSPKMNLMAASAVAGEAAIELSHGARVPLAAPVNGLTPGAALTMGIRPEHITLAPSPEGAVRAQVSVIERLGNETFAHLDVRTQSQELFVVRLDAEANIQPGDWLHLSFPTHRINLFDASGRNLLLNPAL